MELEPLACWRVRVVPLVTNLLLLVRIRNLASDRVNGVVAVNLQKVAFSRAALVECSHHAEGTCYLAINRYRNDDRRPYVFKTTDYGDTWQPINGNLPVSA